jgi:probable rRNA maturation factor
MAEHADDVEVELAIVCEPEGAELADIEGVSDELALRAVALTLARAGVTEPVEVSLLVTDDEHLRQLNRDFRGKDEATDVLSFPLLDAPLVDAPAAELWQEAEDDTPPRAALDGATMPAAPRMADLDGAGYDEETAELDGEDDELEPEAVPLHLGDVAISRETLVRQAQQEGHSSAWEFAYLLAHGVLHLVGYDDQTEAGYRAMVAHQTAVLTELGISR